MGGGGGDPSHLSSASHTYPLLFGGGVREAEVSLSSPSHLFLLGEKQREG